MLAFRAKYVFPIDAPPIADGLVAIDHDRIVAVRPSNSPALAELLPGARDLGDVAILPGLINSHTHLEFSNLREPLGKQGMAFPDWIRLVVKHRRENLLTAGPPNPLLKRIELGLSESTESGVTALGEIASQPWGQHAHIKSEVTIFDEIIGLKSRTTFFGFPDTVNIQRIFTGFGSVLFGLSPHAPYSVHPELLRSCVTHSAFRKFPLAHHLAESREEILLLQLGSGPFVQLLEELDAWDPNAIPFDSRPLNYLRTLSKAHRALVIHGNYLDDEEIGFLAAHSDNMSVVYCPRTHDYFQHDPYPLAKMLAAGVNVALGTDSRASNPDLSIIAELRFAAAKHPLVPPQRLLRMITADAARALGRDEEIGTLTPGKFADLAILSIPSHKVDDPHELLLDPATHVVATVFRGHAVFGDQWLCSPGDSPGAKC